MAKTGRPFALIMKKGNVGKTDLLYNYTKSNQSEDMPEGEFRNKPENRMSRFESIKLIREAFCNDDAIIGFQT